MKNMEKLIVKGCGKLSGSISVQTSKNAVLPILAASILTEEKVVIRNCPNITDVDNMIKILRSLGCGAEKQGGAVIIESAGINKTDVPAELAKELRSSVFLLGSVLGRLKSAVVSQPGGCHIGKRPIDLHIKGLRELNVRIEDYGETHYFDGGNIKGGTVRLDFPSVGATENIMMAAALSRGKTVIINAAKEPEIVDLQNFISAMGGKIFGAGSGTIEIEGVEKLHGCEYTPIPDRIAAGTYLAAAVITGGEAELFNCRCEHIYPLIVKFRETACYVECNNDKIYIKSPKKLNCFNAIETEPYPGFPTDLQAPVVSLASVADGTSIVTENVFETRFKYAEELKKMGADIIVRDRTAIVRGVKKLNGAPVSANDLRGGAALIIAALAAEGKTEISEVRHIDRGYDDIAGVLNALGADIRRVIT